jgi:dolichol-phosphate mannosyltransferase
LSPQLEQLGRVPCPTGPLLVSASPPLASRKVHLSLVIPTLNEAENLAPLIAELTALLEPILGRAYEIIVVDDDSADGTLRLAQELASRDERLRVIARRGERDLSSAVVRGFQVASGEILAVMDADLQHPPEVLLGLLDEIERGVELAVASRHVVGGGVSDWSLRRRVVSRGAQALGMLLLPQILGRLSDPMSGFFMLRRRTIADVELRPQGYKILIELLARGRIRSIAEVGYVFRERSDGGSKVTLATYAHYVRHLLYLRRTLAR